MFNALLGLWLSVSPVPEAPAPRVVDITAPDGLTLKATYYPSATPGPAVLLLHMCNTDRTSWDPLGRQLSAAGIHALAVDYRGYGDSAGVRFTSQAPADQQKALEKWPGDVDAAYAYLLSQPGVDKSRIGAGGGSCGVSQALQVAIRHHEVRSLVLLAGPANRAGREFLLKSPWMPVFTAAAADDQFDADALQSMQWLSELSGNPRSRFVGFPDGRHGTEIFIPHPELPRQIVAWYEDTLVKAPADPGAQVKARTTPVFEFWSALDGSGGVTTAVRMFHETRQRDPRVFLFPEAVMNAVGYEHLAAGKTAEAVELFRMNTEAYPASANAQDSLGDAYLASGQSDLALAAARKCLALLPADKSADEFKARVRESAQQKIDKIAAAPPK
jgi:dienelactone hydrolase